MITSIDAIKQDIYDRIEDIDNETVLIAIKTLIQNIDTESIDQVTDKRDLTGYIKEWVKNM